MPNAIQTFFSVQFFDAIFRSAESGAGRLVVRLWLHFFYLLLLLSFTYYCHILFPINNSKILRTEMKIGVETHE